MPFSKHYKDGVFRNLIEIFTLLQKIKIRILVKNRVFLIVSTHIQSIKNSLQNIEFPHF